METNSTSQWAYSKYFVNVSHLQRQLSQLLLIIAIEYEMMCNSTLLYFPGKSFHARIEIQQDTV
jgi:hypothetical protein